MDFITRFFIGLGIGHYRKHPIYSTKYKSRKIRGIIQSTVAWVVVAGSSINTTGKTQTPRTTAHPHRAGHRTRHTQR